MKMTEKSYRERLNRVTAFLHANLETDIGIEALSDVACLSNYHWHRIYSAMVGETVATTLRRLRLQRAADRLANSNMEISIIAELAQYGSQDAFFPTPFGKPMANLRQPIVEAAVMQPSRRRMQVPTRGGSK